MYFFFQGYGDHRDLHVLTHSFPTRRSSDLDGRPALRRQLDGEQRPALRTLDQQARARPLAARQRQAGGYVIDQPYIVIVDRNRVVAAATRVVERVEPNPERAGDIGLDIDLRPRPAAALDGHGQISDAQPVGINPLYGAPCPAEIETANHVNLP